MRTEGHTFLVTRGGAGLDAATARLLVRQGAGVIVAEVNEEAGKVMAADIGGKGNRQVRFCRPLGNE